MAAFAVLKAFTNRREQRSSQVRQPAHLAASILICGIFFRVLNLSLGAELDTVPVLTVTMYLLFWPVIQYIRLSSRVNLISLRTVSVIVRPPTERTRYYFSWKKATKKRKG